MNHQHLALVTPEPATSQLHKIGSKIRLGDIFTLTNAQELAPAGQNSNNVFGEARKIADNNKGTPVVFAGTFPDGKDRVQATISVANGQSVKDHREKLAEFFQESADNVAANYFSRIEESENGAERNSGHYYLSLTADL